MTAAVGAYRSRMRSTPRCVIDSGTTGTRFDQFIDSFDPADRGQVEVDFEKGKEQRTSRGAFAKLTDRGRAGRASSPDPPLRVTLDDASRATSSRACSATTA